MTLDEAIAHEKELAKEQRESKCNNYIISDIYKKI